MKALVWLVAMLVILWAEVDDGEIEFEYCVLGITDFVHESEEWS